MVTGFACQQEASGGPGTPAHQDDASGTSSINQTSIELISLAAGILEVVAAQQFLRAEAPHTLSHQEALGSVLVRIAQAMGPIFR